MIFVSMGGGRGHLMHDFRDCMIVTILAEF